MTWTVATEALCPRFPRQEYWVVVTFSEHWLSLSMQVEINRAVSSEEAVAAQGA